MPKKTPLPVEGAVREVDALRFATVAGEIMRLPLHPDRLISADPDTPHIGILREKRLHAAIKFYLCPDAACHERPVALLPGLTVGEENSTLRRRMVVDILQGEEIFEVQTGGFYPLREKIRWCLEHTACRVTVVHPIPAIRYLSWINPADGTVLSRRRSPKKGRVKDIAKELYWLSEFVGNPRFSLRLLLVELEEYRMADGWSRDKKRGSSRYECFPTALLGDVTLCSTEDYARYLLPPPEHLPAPFTAAEYAKATGIRGKATYSALALLISLSLLREHPEKRGRGRQYERVGEP